MPRPSADDGQRLDVVSVADAAVQALVDDLELEALGGPDAALGGQRAAEHDGGVVERAVAAGVALDEIGRRPHRRHRALLVQLALAGIHDVRAQDEAVPAVRHLLPRPHAGGDRLVAHLLGYRDVVRLHLAVGVVRAGAYPQAAVDAQHDELHFAARFRAGGLDAVGGGDARGADTVVHGRAGGPRHADLFQLPDVFFHRRDITRCPAGDHRAPDDDGTPRGAVPGDEIEVEHGSSGH